MSDLKLPDDGKKKETSFARIAIWIAVGGVGAYFLVTGIVGIIANG
ncbi:hypothetical protein HD599_003523 [Conyzicola lurida]|jgi:hypothetical protein|uniref:Uncharacterized protein n=1 Tax=Conyzicola lurida TaxID=1172621 RepID=A0A841AMF1_9MICO|nr:hypothetical protein [Conyzicola lurida]MBB5845200.1 hypothetical protein [Conyzicola lurida]